MRFVWNDAKARKNLDVHGVAFEDAQLAFEDEDGVYELDRVVDGEQRWHLTGQAGRITILLVVHTVNYDNNEEVVRIISARVATKRERRKYQQAL